MHESLKRFIGCACSEESLLVIPFVIVTYLSLVDEADDSPLEFFGEFPAIKTQHES